MEKVKKCCINNCSNDAILWKGFLIKSRDKVEAGFCETHRDNKCPNVFNKIGCYGIYHKGLQIIGEIRNAFFYTGIEEPIN